jgi:hypothetical protein
MIKVGDTIYQFDVNRRRYEGSGLSAKIIYKEHFTSSVITGETKQSWLVKEYGRETRVNKAAMQSSNGRYSPSQWYTEEGMKDNIWWHDNYYKLESVLRGCSVEQLKKIAELIGYKED